MSYTPDNLYIVDNHMIVSKLNGIFKTFVTVIKIFLLMIFLNELVKYVDCE